MADQTVRTIYEAVVTRAQRSMVDLARDTDKAADAADKLDASLDKAGKRDVKPKIDVDIREAEKNVRDLTADLEKLEKLESAVKVDAEIDDAETRLDSLREDLLDLESLDASPEVDVQIGQTEAKIQGVLDELDALNGRRAEAVVEADVDAARGDLADAEAELSALQGAKAEMVVTVDADSVDPALAETSESVEEGGESAGLSFAQGMAAGMKSPASAALMRAGVVGLIAAGSAAAIRASLGLVEMGFEPVRAEDVFGAGAGLDEATARRFGAAAGEAYSNAWGDSVQQNLATASSALNNALVPSTATQSEIQAVIEQLTAVSELLGVDVTEAAEAAGNMVKNGLAANAEEAFDVIIRGQQEGLNRSEDWIDTLREYSSMFQSLGLSGAEAGGLIEQAMDAGARNSDVAADALKEFSIRAQDDSKATRQAFKDLGLDADEMGLAISKGGDTAKEGLDTVLDGLRGVTDEQERNQLGVALFGTMWEDMGNGAGVLAMDLDDLSGSWVNVGDTTETAMARMSDNAASSLEKTRRTVENTVTQIAGGLAAGWEEPLQDLSDWVLTHRSDIVDWILEAQAAFFDGARAVVEFGATIVEVSGNAAGALAPIVDGLGQAVEAAGILAGNDDLASFGQDIQDAADGMEEWSDNADTAAQVMREDWIAAIDETEQRVGTWTAPVALRAQLDDAIYGMTMRLDEFSAHVDEAGGTVQINGDALPAEEAMNTLIEEVSKSNGTVNINGETVDAEDALDRVVELAGEGAEIVITANTLPAETELDAFWERQGYAPPEVPVSADTTPAEGDVEEFSGAVMDGDPASVPVTADTGDADAEVARFSGSVMDGEPAAVPVTADTVYAEEEARRFVAAVNESGGTVEINGESLNAQEALDTLLMEIDNGDGTVTINGVTVPAEDALYWLIAAINGQTGEVTIDGDPSKANEATNSAKRKADGTTGTVTVDANASPAESKANRAARDRNSTIDVDANTSSANFAINLAARTRTAYINVVARNVGSSIGRIASGRAYGGVVGGLAGGGTVGTGYGIVPGPTAAIGVDNVLWPLASGGQVLSQPLAGGEWVINPISSKQHDSVLAAINAGASRAELAAALGGGATSGDASWIVAAVADAMSSWRPMVQIGDRDFYGQMKRSERMMGGRR